MTSDKWTITYNEIVEERDQLRSDLACAIEALEESAAILNTIVHRGNGYDWNADVISLTVRIGKIHERLAKLKGAEK